MSLFDDLLLVGISDHLIKADARQRRNEARLRSAVRLVDLSERLAKFQETLDRTDLTYDAEVHRTVQNLIRKCREDINRERDIINPPPRESLLSEWSNKITSWATH